MKTVTLTFNNVTSEISSNAQGMFDLTQVWLTWMGGDSAKSPSAFSTDCPKGVSLNQESQIMPSPVAPNQLTGTLGALYAYVMWCDAEFYVVTAKAFKELAKRELRCAEEAASSLVIRHTHQVAESYLTCLGTEDDLSESHNLKLLITTMMHDEKAISSFLIDIDRSLTNINHTMREFFWDDAMFALRWAQEDYWQKSSIKEFDLDSYEGYTRNMSMCSVMMKQLDDCASVS